MKMEKINFINYNQYKEINKDHFIKVKNSIEKPEFGFWATINNEDFPNPWEEFRKDIGISNTKRNIYKIGFNLKPNSKIYIINRRKHLKELYKKYELKNEYSAMMNVISFFDFEKMSEDFDGILLTKRGNEKCHSCFKRPNLYSWHVPSLLLFNVDCIENQYLIE